MTTVTERSYHAAVPVDFVSGPEGLVVFTGDIAEPDKDGGALRYCGVDIEDLVGKPVTFGTETMGVHLMFRGRTSVSYDPDHLG